MLRGMAPIPHAIMPKSWRMWLKLSLTSVGLKTSSVYCKSPWNLSHPKVVCLLALAITFFLLQNNWARGFFKTYTFIVVWTWTFKPYSQINGCLGLPSSMVTLQCARKCYTKLYVAIYNALHPSTLQKNLGPSLAQWTPSMATRGRAIISKTKNTIQ